MQIPDKVKAEVISIANTFVVSFFLTLGASVQAGSISWSISFWAAVVTAAGRSALKTVVNSFVPVRLGGRKA